jgi:L-2-hydroxyglutarate oxidase LhgO
VQVPEDLDAIVIGSGIGGLSTAVIMAKVSNTKSLSVLSRTRVPYFYSQCEKNLLA